MDRPPKITRDDVLLRFKKTVKQMEPMNVIIIGTSGVGKSSFLNTVMTSFSDTRHWVERAMVGCYEDTGRQETFHLIGYERDQYITDESERAYAYPTLLDTAGLEDEDSSLIREIFRVILFGRLREREPMQDLHRFISQNLHDINIIRERYSTVREKYKVNRIIFIASANPRSNIPIKLIDAILSVAHSPEMVIPHYGVLTHCDLVDEASEEFREKAREFKSHLGLPDSRFLKCRNYCDSIFGTKNKEETKEEIEIPVIEFMTQVCDPRIVTPDTGARYHKRMIRIDPNWIRLSVIVCILAFILYFISIKK